MTIKNLKRKQLIFLPSDKGGEFCVVDKARYVTAGFEHLADTNTYRKIAHMQPKTIEAKVNRVWTTICDSHELPLRTKRSFVTTNSSIPTFYHLIKTHKSMENLKIRPIVSNIRGPTHKISWLLSHILRPLLSNIPAHLQSSDILMERLLCLQPPMITEFPYPCSLDVVALYTSIPLQESISNVISILESQNFTYAPLTHRDIEELLNVILENTYFQFENEIFLQIRGLAMGSSVSPIMAILFMHTVERIALTSSSGLLTCYGRYVDDIFFLTKDRQTAEEFHELMNNIHPAIKFEIEHPSSNNSLSLLDLCIKVH
jgi:hypothetical protein